VTQVALCSASNWPSSSHCHAAAAAAAAAAVSHLSSVPTMTSIARRSHARHFVTPDGVIDSVLSLWSWCLRRCICPTSVVSVFRTCNAMTSREAARCFVSVSSYLQSYTISRAHSSIISYFGFKCCSVVFSVAFRLLVINTSSSVFRHQQIQPLTATSNKCHQISTVRRHRVDNTWRSQRWQRATKRGSGRK